MVEKRVKAPADLLPFQWQMLAKVSAKYGPYNSHQLTRSISLSPFCNCAILQYCELILGNVLIDNSQCRFCIRL